MTPNTPTVRIIVLDVTPEANVERCIRSLAATEYPSISIDFITANERNAHLATGLFPRVNVIRRRGVKVPREYNLSSGTRHAAQADYLAFIHANSEVDKLWLAQAMNIAALDGEIAVLGMRIICGNNGESSFPRGRYMKQWGLWEPHDVDDTVSKSARYAYCVDPRAVIIKSALIPRLGRFTESLDLYGSMQDFCYRAWTRGLKVVSVPSAAVHSVEEVARRGGYVISRAALYTLVRNYELKTLRKFRRPIIGFHLKRKNTRNRPAFLSIAAAFISLVRERIQVQKARVLSDSQIFELVDGEFYPLNAIAFKRDIIVMGLEEEQSLVSGWSHIFSNHIGGQEVLCRAPSLYSKFQLYTEGVKDVVLNVEAFAGSEPASMRFLINGRFIGNAYLDNCEHKTFAFDVPLGGLQEGVINGEIQLRYGGGGECKKGLMIRKIWITKRSHARPYGKSKIKILMSGYDDFTGPGMKHLYKFADILEQNGFSVLVLYPGSPKSILSMGETPKFDLCNLELDGLSLNHRMIAEIADFKPDIAHLWTPRYIPSLVGIEAKRAHGSRLIVHYEDNEKVLYDFWRKRPCSKGSMIWAINPKTFAMLNELADCFTAICEPLRAYLTKRHNKNTFLLYPGADLKRFRPMAKDPNLMDKFALQNRIVLMYAGTIHDANLEDFVSVVEALAAIKNRYAQIMLVHCGLDICGQNIPRRVSDLGVQKNILFLGRIDFRMMHRYLSIADILIQPGRNNDFNEYRLPAKLPEYLAMGKPVIMFSAGIGEELVEGKEVLKLHHGDAGELAERIEELIINKELRNELSSGARRKAEEMFDWEKNAQGLIGIYEKMAKDSGRGRN